MEEKDDSGRHCQEKRETSEARKGVTVHGSVA